MEASGPEPSRRGRSPTREFRRGKNGLKFLDLTQLSSRSQRSTSLCFREKQRLVGFISKEGGVIELEEDKAEEERKELSVKPHVIRLSQEHCDSRLEAPH